MRAAAAAVLIVLIPLSRVYLGVHFPTDLLAGYLLGAALLVVYIRLEPRIEAWLRERSTALQLLFALAAPSLILLLSPRIDAYQVRTAASLAGMGAGFVLERRWVRFASDGSWQRRGLRLLCGMALLILIRQGLGFVTAGAECESVARFVRYLFLGLGGSLIAPWLFVSLGLARREEKSR